MMDEKKKSFYAKIGMILIKLTDHKILNSLENLWNKSEQHEEYYDKIFWLHGEVENTLKKCTDIKNIKRIRELRKEHFESFIHYCEENAQFIQESSSILSFDLFLPKAERKYAFDVRYDEKVIEKAHVLYNGNIFLAYAEADEETSLTLFGQEVREFLKECLTSHLWEVMSVPPCPLHPDINVYISDEDLINIEIDKEDDIHIDMPHKHLEKINDFFIDLLEDLSFSINCFTSAATINQKLNKIFWELQEVTDNITIHYKKLLNLKWPQIKQKFALMHKVRCLSLDAQVLSNKFSHTELKLKKERESFSLQRGNTWNENILRNYFYNYFTVPPVSLHETRETIRYTNEIISNKYLHYYTILAALIGGMIGAIITGIPSIVSFLNKTIIAIWGKQ